MKLFFISRFVMLFTTIFIILTSCSKAQDKYSFTFEGKNYEIIMQKMSWKDAAAYAVQNNGYLVQIDSKEEQDAIYEAIINSGIPTNYQIVFDGGGVSYIWIGATDYRQEGKWIWDGDDDGNGINFWNGEGLAGSGNGSKVGDSFVNWGGASKGSYNEPDNFNGNQHCAAIALSGWPANISSLGIAGEWNDINMNNQLYFIVEYDNSSGMNENINNGDKCLYKYCDNSNTLFLMNLYNYNNILIYNSIGSLLFNKKLENINDYVLDLSEYSSGIYLISLTNYKGKELIKIIKK